LLRAYRVDRAFLPCLDPFPEFAIQLGRVDCTTSNNELTKTGVARHCRLFESKTLTRRFEKDVDAEGQLDKTLRLESVKQEDYDTVFYPGGHGLMWDLAEDPNSIKLIESFLAAGKPVALVCHAPGVLRHVKTAAGKPLVEGKKRDWVHQRGGGGCWPAKVVPFLVEDELLSLGATYSKIKNWGVHVVTDGLLITGQNPASSGPTAKVLINALRSK
jgi:putative intracellular protease/amidase